MAFDAQTLVPVFVSAPVILGLRAVVGALWKRHTGKPKESLDLAGTALLMGGDLNKQAFDYAEREKGARLEAEANLDATVARYEARITALEARHQAALDAQEARHTAEGGRRDGEVTRLLGEVERLTDELDKAHLVVKQLVATLETTRADLHAATASLRDLQN